MLLFDRPIEGNVLMLVLSAKFAMLIWITLLLWEKWPKDKLSIYSNVSHIYTASNIWKDHFFFYLALPRSILKFGWLLPHKIKNLEVFYFGKPKATIEDLVPCENVGARLLFTYLSTNFNSKTSIISLSHMAYELFEQLHLLQSSIVKLESSFGKHRLFKSRTWDWEMNGDEEQVPTVTSYSSLPSSVTWCFPLHSTCKITIQIYVKHQPK